MEIVIKISEEEYSRIKENDMGFYNGRFSQMVRKGTPLPKGHGKIVDIDKVLEEMKVTRTYDIPFALERVKSIIPADTSESGGEE